MKLRGKWRVSRSRRTDLLIIPSSVSLALNMGDIVPSMSPAPDTVVSSSVSLRLV